MNQKAQNLLAFSWRQVTPLLFLVPALALAYVATTRLQGAFEEQEHEALLAAANRVSAMVDGFIKSNLDSISAESQLPLFSEVMRSYHDGNLTGHRREDGLRMLAALKAKSELYIIAYGLLDHEGNVILDANSSRIGKVESDLASAGSRLKAGAWMSDIKSEATGVASFSFLANIRGSRGAPVGYLRATYVAGVLQTFLSRNHALLGPDSFALLTDSGGQVLGNSRDPNAVSQPANLGAGFEGLQRGPASVLAQRPWTAEYLIPQAVLAKRVAKRVGNAALLFSVLVGVIAIKALVGLAILRRLRLREVELTVAKATMEEALQREHLWAQQVEKDLRLGRIVQEAFHALPELPHAISIECFSSAAQFVSGDTYFVHYAPDDERLTILLHDLTGHGIQAALKASACQMIARSIWQHSSRKVPSDEAFLRYDSEVKRFTRELGTEHEVNAILGVDLDIATGKMRLFRSNHNAPIMVRPFGGKWLQNAGLLSNHWKAQVIHIPQLASAPIQLDHGSFVVMLSDGILDSSRAEAKLIRYLQEEIAASRSTCSTAAVGQLIRTWRDTRSGMLVDDQTMIVIQWRPNINNEEATA